MQWTVYRLRDKGGRLEKNVVRALAASGTFHFYARFKREGWPSIMLATLTWPNYDYVVPCLDQARVLQITPKGILITGIEMIPLGSSYKSQKFDRYRQTWWCIPCVPAPADQASQQGHPAGVASETGA